jgi:hypothetical protein
MFKHYSILWIAYAVLLTAALFGLEIAEGYKITTTEYYGMQNIGPIYLFMLSALAVVLYPVTFMPLTMLLGRFVRLTLLRMIIYAAIGGAAGYKIFHGMYDFGDDYFIREYGLDENTGVLLFGAAALFYGGIDHYVRHRKKPGTR